MEAYTTREVVAATNNQHKLSEIRAAVGPDFRILSLEDIGCHDELPETMDTLEGNALQKAAYVFERFHLPCFADDTGLEVDALGGAPGVFSARYAGEHKDSEANMALLLRNMAGKPNRKARFRTVIAVVGPDGHRTFEGVLPGVILDQRRGSGGFGYDPVFQPDQHKRTLAEMTVAEKNAISHRGQAVRQLVDWLNTLKV